MKAAGRVLLFIPEYEDAAQGISDRHDQSIVLRERGELRASREPKDIGRRDPVLASITRETGLWLSEEAGQNVRTRFAGPQPDPVLEAVQRHALEAAVCEKATSESRSKWCRCSLGRRMRHVRNHASPSAPSSRQRQ